MQIAQHVVSQLILLPMRLLLSINVSLPDHPHPSPDRQLSAKAAY